MGKKRRHPSLPTVHLHNIIYAVVQIMLFHFFQSHTERYMCTDTHTYTLTQRVTDTLTNTYAVESLPIFGLLKAV